MSSNNDRWTDIQDTVKDVIHATLFAVGKLLEWILAGILVLGGFLAVMILTMGLVLLAAALGGFLPALILSVLWPAITARFEQLPSWSFWDLWMICTLIIFFLRVIGGAIFGSHSTSSSSK